MQRSDTQDSRTLGVSLIASGAMLAASAAVYAFAAANHMAVAATLCGPATSHCILCAVSMASLLASAGVVAAGMALLRAHPYPLRQRAGRSPRQTT